MAKHTPGPWIIKDTLKTKEFIPVGPKDDVHVALVYLHKFNTIELVTEEWNANASLIAAAPELLEVINKLFDFITDIREKTYAEKSRLIEQIGNIIRKANGEV